MAFTTRNTPAPTHSGQVNHFGEELLGATLMRVRNAAAAALPAASATSPSWCQGCSEPGAGDLASVATTAELDGDEWVMDGQKVWTSLAHLSRNGAVLAPRRSSQHHAGLSYLLMPLDQPGIRNRPSCRPRFNELFFDDAAPTPTVIAAPAGRIGDADPRARRLDAGSADRLRP